MFFPDGGGWGSIGPEWGHNGPAGRGGGVTQESISGAVEPVGKTGPLAVAGVATARRYASASRPAPPRRTATGAPTPRLGTRPSSATCRLNATLCERLPFSGSLTSVVNLFRPTCPPAGAHSISISCLRIIAHYLINAGNEF